MSCGFARRCATAPGSLNVCRQSAGSLHENAEPDAFAEKVQALAGQVDEAKLCLSSEDKAWAVVAITPLVIEAAGTFRSGCSANPPKSGAVGARPEGPTYWHAESPLFGTGRRRQGKEKQGPGLGLGTSLSPRPGRRRDSSQPVRARPN